MNNMEQTGVSKKQLFADRFLLSLLEQNPQVIKPEVGSESFVKDLLKANEIYHRLSPDTIGTIKDLMPFFKICPHIFKPGLGIAHLLEELSKTANIFLHHLGRDPNGMI